jgi:hypothetical protein
MKFYPGLFLLLISLSASAQKWQPEPPATPLSELLDSDPTYHGEERDLDMILQSRSPSEETLLYEPAKLYGRNTAIEFFTASYYVLRKHTAPAAIPQVSVRPGNSLPVRLLMQGVSRVFPGIQGQLASALKKSGQLSGADADAAGAKVFEILDFAGATEFDRGLPFFEDFIAAFSDPLWAGYAQTLESLIESRFQNRITGKTSLFDLALQATGGSHDRAVRLLALVLSADLRTLRYFQYFKTPATMDVVRTITRLPKLIRTYAEFTRWRESTPTDQFTYPGKGGSGALRSQYFWTEAYLAQRLLRSGYSPDVVKTLCRVLVERFQKVKRTQQQIGFRVRTDGRNALVAGTLTWIGAEFFNQVNRSGESKMGLAYLAGAAGGVWLSQKYRKDPKAAEMKQSQPELAKLAFRGVDFAVALLPISCNGAVGSGPEAPALLAP